MPADFHDLVLLRVALVPFAHRYLSCFVLCARNFVLLVLASMGAGNGEHGIARESKTGDGTVRISHGSNDRYSGDRMAERITGAGLDSISDVRIRVFHDRQLILQNRTRWPLEPVDDRPKFRANRNLFLFIVSGSLSHFDHPEQIRPIFRIQQERNHIFDIYGGMRFRMQSLRPGALSLRGEAWAIQAERIMSGIANDPRRNGQDRRRRVPIAQIASFSD